MMDWLDVVRILHVLGACILIGTGAGIAFFMLMANRTEDAARVAHTASIVVIADMFFTLTAAISQPITGLILAVELGWCLTEGWLLFSLGLYVFIGLFWVPVIFIQIRMRDEAIASANASIALTARYHRLYRIWFACGFPAFFAIIVLLALMIVRPSMGG